MQGWRNTMEDSHITCLTLENNVSVFGVFDGHGGKSRTTYLNDLAGVGREVALYVKDYFIGELQKLQSFKNRDYSTALREVFIKMDDMLKTP